MTSPPPQDPANTASPRSDLDLLRAAASWVAAGHRVAMATVLETWGSAPCPVGARLVVRDDGHFAGSVSGGCVEADVIAEALEVIDDGTARALDFGVSDDVARQAGLSCGGRIALRVEPVGPGGLAPQTLERIVAGLDARRASIRIIDLEGGERLVFADTLDTDDLAEITARTFAAGRSRRVVTADGRTLFLSLAAPVSRLCIVGAVHMAQALATMATMIDLDVAILDPRAAFATPERFPGHRLLVGWPETVIGTEITLDAATAVVALAHRPEIDDPALIAALAADCFYVGALGSRKNHARRLERLAAAGVDPARLTRLRAPVGLPIHAATPPEIAVAILAEIIAEMRRPLVG